MHKQNVINLGIDNGAGVFQLQTTQNRFSMENKIDEGRYQAPEVKADNTYNVIYKGKQYLVGSGATNYTSQIEGKDTEKHLIAMLVGLSQTVPNGFKINLGTGESMNKYFDKKHKEEMIRKFLGEHEITVDGDTYNYTFQNIHILPEGIGHKLLEPSKYKNKESYTIDIGASTANFIFSEKGLAPEEKTSFSFSLGMHKLVKNIETRLARAGFGEVNESKIENFIKNGCKNEEVNNIVDEEIRKIINALEYNLKVRGVNLKSTLIEEIEFVGGTSLCLKNALKREYPNAVFIDEGNWVNAKGFAKFVVNKYSR